MNLRSNVTLLGLLAVITAQADPLYFSLTGNYYDFVSGTQTWTSAKADAETKTFAGKRGRLVTITSADENDFLVTNWGVRGANGWIGFTQADGSSEPAGGWGWITGESVSYLNWDGPEPNNNGGEKYAHMYTNGRWNDDIDSPRVGQNGYYIEYAEPVPEPLTLATLGLGCAVLARRRKSR